ncbi:ANXA7_11 [Mytilus edulis]|uniref:Annexin n=1 Tax=Mytilus edulis TaxID=6550 RepID=A0A8S3QEI1_MYTED|nr:ANXA7_11 [Mytilus edulis]
MAYPPPGGYNPYAYQNPYQQNPYCGGYTYSNSAYNVNYGQQQQAYNQYYSQPQMQQAPPSQQTNIVYNMMFNSDAAFQQAGAECLGMDLDDVEVSDIEDEEEEEDEDEDVKETRKKFKKKCKKRQKIAQKVAEKCAEEDDFLERVRASYIGRLASHLAKDGTIDPTEGTVKPYKTYDAEDPVVAFINEKEGLDITGNDWDAERDCMYFDEAMQGLGTNEEAIIHICATRSNSQRQELKKMFKTAFGKDLIETLDGEVSGDFSEVLFALFEPPALYDALNIKKAIQGLGTDESVLIEILLTRTNAQIEEMKSVYGSINPDDCATDKDLECNIEDDTSGDLKRILISAAQGNRAEVKEEKLNDAVVPVMFHDEETDEDLPTGAFTIDMEKLIDPDRAQADAEVLFNAGVDSFGTDEDDFIRIFALRDTYQLRETYNRYVKLTQCDIENSVEGEFSSHSQMALITLSKLIGIKISSQIDMVQIKEIFLEKNKQTLWNWIKDDCSGDYKALLQRIVGKN